jgi:integrase
MSVRKRTWKNRDGSRGETWLVAYADQAGIRRQRAFERKRDADAYHATVAVDVRAGLHVPDSQSITVAEAAQLWLQSREVAGLERTTLVQYRQHVALHIDPLLGMMKLSQLSIPAVRAFEDKLRQDRSPPMVRKILVSLSSILSDAQERGSVTQNVARGLRSRRRRGGDRRHDARQKGKLEAGVDIPTPDEVRAIIPHLIGRWRPFFLTAIFTGLRASELRGLRLVDIDLKRGELQVRQRADRFRVIGQLKSGAGERTVPLLPMVVNALREWQLMCPKGELGLAFPDGSGRIEVLPNIVRRAWHPIQISAGVVDERGLPKYPGLHALRHFYASWCINRRADGGLELPLKVVQARLGHASIQMTADRYGHLFPPGDDSAELAAAEKAFLGS